MSQNANIAELDPVLVLGEPHPLIEQLGSTEGLVTLSSLSAALSLPRVDSRPSLELFLQAYRSHFLLPLELPTIHQAYVHTARYEIRELIAMDRRLEGTMLFKDFANASRRVGRSQLSRLRPLRDERIVQRYLHAVEAGEAHGWHTVVYGLTLAIYSLPLRQGLLNYGRQTLRGFIHSAAPRLQLSEEEVIGLLDEAAASMPAAVEALLKSTLPHPPTPLRLETV
jgi:urease accessory protein UreF